VLSVGEALKFSEEVVAGVGVGGEGNIYFEDIRGWFLSRRGMRVMLGMILEALGGSVSVLVPVESGER